MNSIAVREANRGDLKDFLGLYAEFYNELRLKRGLRTYNVNELRDDAERILARDKVFLAKDGEGKPVGFIRISAREGCYWFEELYVRPEYRGQGVGRRLVETAEKYVAERNPFAYVMILPQNREALKFWLHMGYTLLNTIELAKNLNTSREEDDTRPFLLLSNIVKIYRWAKESYSPLEKQFLKLLKEFTERGGTGEELLKILVNTLKTHLAKDEKSLKKELPQDMYGVDQGKVTSFMEKDRMEDRE